MTPTPPARPSKDESAQLPPFEGLPPGRIHLVSNRAQIDFALQALTKARCIGFDTESKPTFRVGDVSGGPHVIQFATLDDAFIVQVGPGTPMDFLKIVLESQAIVKVGFGLKSDRGPLQEKLGLRVGGTVDLSHALRKLGYRQAVGVKAAVAIVLGKRLQKSRSISTSNWSLPTLSARQLRYAADDAHASLAVFHALDMDGVSLRDGDGRKDS